MADSRPAFQPAAHAHVFLGPDHETAERRTWAVIILCSVMMFAEIIGGVLFGSLALIADGLHMSTHAGALLLAALATVLHANTLMTGVLRSAPASSAILPDIPAPLCWR